MDKKHVLEAIKKIKESSKKRNFSQSYDFIVTLKGLNLKNPEEQVDFYAVLPFSKGKKTKVCGFVGAELIEQAKKVLDKAILVDDFKEYDKKKQKKLAEEYDYFIAQANIMGKVAAVFGKVLGPRGKMPNPKAGCVVPPKANLANVYEKLQKTIRIKAKTALMAQCSVGNENMNDEEVAENIISVYQQIVHHLPNHENNIKKMYVKLTMGKPVEIK